MKIDVYIWGIRRGFQTKEALYPVIANLAGIDESKYHEIVEHFNDEKDTWFRNCDQNFYYLTKDNTHKLFSLVISNHKDIAGRTSFLVFSICCPKETQIKGDLLTALNDLSELYKTKNADYTQNINKFTRQQVEKRVDHLSLNKSGIQNGRDRIIYDFDNQAQINNLNDLMGQNVFVIPVNSNKDMLAILNGYTKESLSDRDIARNNKTKKKEQLIDILRSKDETKFEEASALYNEVSDDLDSVNNNNYVQWRKQRNTDNDLTSLKSDLIKELKKAETNKWDHNPDKAKQIYNQNQNYFQDKKDELNKWISNYKEIKETKSKEFISQLYTILKNAESKNWDSDPNEFIRIEESKEDIIIPADCKEKYDNWVNKYRDIKIESFKAKCDKLYTETKNLRQKNIKDQHGKFDQIKLDVNSLNLEIGKKIKELQSYKDLDAKFSSKEKGSPWLMRALFSLVCISLCVGVWVFLRTTEPTGLIDQDRDGLLAPVDQQETPLKDTSIALKKFINANGVVEQNKTDSICACFKVKDKQDRKILLCDTTTSEWFIYDNILYNYDAAKKVFINEQETRIKNGIKFNILDEYCKSKKFKDYSEEKKEPKTDEEIEVTYNKKKYKIKRGYTEEKGMKKGNALFRFKDNKWEKAESDKPEKWDEKKVTTNDLNVLWIEVPADKPPVVSDVDDDGDGIKKSKDPDDKNACEPKLSCDKCDQDSDGLTNKQENEKGTKPTHPDSDGDGVNDGADNCPLVSAGNSKSKTNKGCPEEDVEDIFWKEYYAGSSTFKTKIQADCVKIRSRIKSKILPKTTEGKTARQEVMKIIDDCCPLNN